MSRATTIAISEIHCCALRMRLCGYVAESDAARLRAARDALGHGHDLAQHVDYFLTACLADPGGVVRQAERLRDAVLAHLRPARPRRDMGEIYG